MPATQVLFVDLVVMFSHFQGLPLGELPMRQTSLPTKLLQLACEAFWLQEYSNIQEENVSKTYWENPHQFIKFQRKEIPEFEIYSYTDGCKEMLHGHSQLPSVPCIFCGSSTLLETIQVRYLGVIHWVPIFLSFKRCVTSSEKRGTSKTFLPTLLCAKHCYLPTICTIHGMNFVYFHSKDHIHSISVFAFPYICLRAFVSGKIYFSSTTERFWNNVCN